MMYLVYKLTTVFNSNVYTDETKKLLGKTYMLVHLPTKLMTWKLEIEET